MCSVYVNRTEFDLIVQSRTTLPTSSSPPSSAIPRVRCIVVECHRRDNPSLPRSPRFGRKYGQAHNTLKRIYIELRHPKRPKIPPAASGGECSNANPDYVFDRPFTPVDQ